MKIINTLLVFNILFFFIYFIPDQLPKEDINTKKAIIKVDSLVYADISAVGDMMCHSTQFYYAQVGKDTFDFSSIYEDLLHYFVEPDLMAGNFESVVSEKGGPYRGFPIFNTPVDFLKDAKKAGFDVIFTANNHSYDQSEKGVLRTIDSIRALNMASIGTYSSKEVREKVHIFNLNGIKVSMSAYAYGINGFTLPDGKDYLVNFIDTVKIKNDLKKAVKKGAEVKIVYLHFGSEYQKEPNRQQKKVVEFLKENGAEIIIASHPHVLQPIEKFAIKDTNSLLDTGFVAYSLGNFISNQRWRYSDCGVILNFSLQKNLFSKKIKLNELSYIPFWVYKGYYIRKRVYKILPSELSVVNNYPVYMPDSSRQKMAQSFDDSKRIINKYQKIKLKSVLDTNNSIKLPQNTHLSYKPILYY